MTLFKVLIVTHANRIKNVLSVFGVRQYEPVNCAVLKIAFTYNEGIHNYKVNIEQLRGAGVNDRENITLYDGMVSAATIEPFMPSSTVSEKHDFDYYIVRHGQGFHNFKTVSTMVGNLSKSDPILTETGKEQAFRAGQFISTLGISFNVFFVSPLQRTHLTLLHIIRGIYHRKSKQPSSITAIVLPLSEEISAFFNPGKENTSDCFVDRTVLDMERCHAIKTDDSKVKINISWDVWEQVIGKETAYFKSNTMLYFAAAFLTGILRFEIKKKVPSSYTNGSKGNKGGRGGGKTKRRNHMRRTRRTRQ